MIEYELHILLVALLMIACPCAANADEEWKLVKDKRGIKVYTRPFHGSKVDEFKGTTIINARIESVLALFKNIEEQPEWMDRCIDARMVKRANDFEGIIYNVTELPWPCDNRDVVVKQYFKVDSKGRVVIDFHAIEEADTLVPRRKDTVRMTQLRGQWIFVSLDRSQTQATYRIQLNPNGMIPHWIANYASRSIPYETLRSVVERVKEKQYIKLGKKLRDQYSKVTYDIVKGRLRDNADEIGDPALLEMLQNDQQLLDAILCFDGEVRPLIYQWVEDYYIEKNGEWIKKKRVSAND